MRTPLAWKNVTHNKIRAATSLAGVGFATLLIFMQLGFYDACFRSSIMVFDLFDFDIALVSPQYVHLRAASDIPESQLKQARGVRVDGAEVVQFVSPLYVGNCSWRNPQDRRRREILVLGVNPRDQPFRRPDLADSVEKLREENSDVPTAIVDSKAQSSYGTVEVGDVTELENVPVKVVATYGYGSGFISDAAVIVSDKTLAKLSPLCRLNHVNIGLVKLKPGTNLEAAKAALSTKLTDNVKVMTRSELEDGEQHYFVSIKPLGIMFASGVMLAFVVGAVILYQILAAEIMNKLKEYATLKAVGYTNGFMNKVVLQQATIFALMGFLPAMFLAMGLYELTRLKTNLPMVMTWQRVVFVLVLSVVMCGFSGFLAARKVAKADPADLF